MRIAAARAAPLASAAPSQMCYVTATCGTATGCLPTDTSAGFGLRGGAPGPCVPVRTRAEGEAAPPLAAAPSDVLAAPQGCSTALTHPRLATNPTPVGERRVNQSSVAGEREVCAGRFGLKFKRFKLRFAVTRAGSHARLLESACLRCHPSPFQIQSV